MISLTASSDFGHTGQYVARITGRDSKFTFRREFIGSRYGKRNEGTSADIDEPGLYEIRDVSRKGKNDRYRLVLDRDGALALVRTSKEDAMKIAKELDAGRRFSDIVRHVLAADDANSYEIISPAAAVKIAVAQTLETAVEACWAVLQALPEREAKKVLAALKARVSPPKVSKTEPKSESEGPDSCLGSDIS